MIGPPTDVPPARLFRLLTRCPRPWLPVELSIRGHARGFSCVALSCAEWAELSDRAAMRPEPVRSEWTQLEAVAQSLRHYGAPAFRSAEHIAEVCTHDEVMHLSRAVGKAIGIIAPQRPLFDQDMWLASLRAGARDPLNGRIAYALALCFDAAPKRALPRLDRFFGVPLRELTEGQWLAYRAAQEVIFEKS